MAIITSYNLTKEYKGQSGLHELNLTIEEGSKVAIVGEAGCGKTTALRLFSGLATPTSGECKLMGLNPTHEYAKIHARTGFFFESFELFENMTVNENLLYQAKLHSVDSNDAIDRISFLLHKLDIWDVRDERVAKITTSDYQKLKLAHALVHKPSLLLLDEPTDGMNIETTTAVKETIDYIVEEEEATVVMCTRHYHHAEMMCDFFVIMKDGEVIAKGDMNTLVSGSGLKSRAVLRIADDCDPPAGFSFLDSDKWYKEISSEQEMPELIEQVANSTKVIEISVERPNLAEIFDEYTSGRYRMAGITEAAETKGDDDDEQSTAANTSESLTEEHAESASMGARAGDEETAPQRGQSEPPKQLDAKLTGSDSENELDGRSAQHGNESAGNDEADQDLGL